MTPPHINQTIGFQVTFALFAQLTIFQPKCKLPLHSATPVHKPPLDFIIDQYPYPDGYFVKILEIAVLHFGHKPDDGLRLMFTFVSLHQLPG